MYVLFSFEFWSNKVEWKANESVWGKNVMAWNNFMAHDFFRLEYLRDAFNGHLTSHSSFITQWWRDQCWTKGFCCYDLAAFHSLPWLKWRNYAHNVNPSFHDGYLWPFARENSQLWYERQNEELQLHELASPSSFSSTTETIMSDEDEEENFENEFRKHIDLCNDVDLP